MEKENCRGKYEPAWSPRSGSQDGVQSLVIDLYEARKTIECEQTSAARVDWLILERVGFAAK